MNPANLFKRGAGASIAILALTGGCRSAAKRSPAPLAAAPTSVAPLSPTSPLPPLALPENAIAAAPPVATETAGVAPVSAAAPANAILRPASATSQSLRATNEPAAALVDEPLVWQGRNGQFAIASPLAVEQVVEVVLRQNPSIEAMHAAWHAAAQRYPQVISLDDPVLMSMVAPASLNSNTVNPGFILGGSQKLPWFGKRAARGRMAQAEASVAFQDAQSTRLEVAETARLAFYDYYLVRRLLDSNRENRIQTEQFRDTARRRFEANLAPQQDVLQAEVALSEVARRQLELERMNRVAAARLNTLLLREPDAPLPPPPAALARLERLPPAAELRGLALNYRPDLAALGARIRVEEASAAIAAKDFYPDVEVYGRYDSFWQPSATQGPLRAQTGVNMNVPLNRGKRQASVNEALFRASQRRAEYQQRLNDVQFEVQNTYEQVEQSRQTLDLYDERFLPAARGNVQNARAGYDVGRVQFQDLTQAQQQLIALREKREEALTDCYRRQAELERAIGCPLPKAIERPAEKIPTPPPSA